ncbi:hypothetical protein APED_24610 [Acanthopleuribacter pedis]
MQRNHLPWVLWSSLPVDAGGVGPTTTNPTAHGIPQYNNLATNPTAHGIPQYNDLATNPTAHGIPQYNDLATNPTAHGIPQYNNLATNPTAHTMPHTSPLHCRGQRTYLLPGLLQRQFTAALLGHTECTASLRCLGHAQKPAVVVEQAVFFP